METSSIKCDAHRYLGSLSTLLASIQIALHGSDTDDERIPVHYIRVTSLQLSRAARPTCGGGVSCYGVSFSSVLLSKKTPKPYTYFASIMEYSSPTSRIDENHLARRIPSPSSPEGCPYPRRTRVEPRFEGGWMRYAGNSSGQGAALKASYSDGSDTGLYNTLIGCSRKSSRYVT